jgi:hypothetical protein
MIALAALLLAPVLLAALSGGEGSEPGSVAAFGRPVYTNVTGAAGLEGFRHAGYLGPGNVLDPPAYFVEASGPGACWLDADQDALLDLYLVNGLYQTSPAKNGELDPHSMLYRNLGDGAFADISAASGADLRGTYMGCAAADYDDDGRTDLYVTGWNGNVLLRNLGAGVFANVTATAGVGDAACDDGFACWGSAASWFDYDLDGCLDLYVGHFTPFDASEPPEGNGPDVGQRNRLFHAACDGTFADATSAAGLFGEVKDTWSSVAADYDNDGFPDLYVSNDGDPNDLYLNDHDGTFTRVASTVADNAARNGMGTAVADWNRDGRLDIVSTNYVGQLNGLFESQGSDYVDIGSGEPFTDADPWSGWGTHLYDMNNDGFLDLVVVNGLTEDFGPAPREPMLAYEQVAGAWRAVGPELGADFDEDFVARGAAWADYDDDGDLDMLVVEAGDAPAHLFRADGTAGNFLNVDLVGGAATGTRDAVGARVTLTASGVGTQMQEKVLGSGYLSTNDPRLHFGLADAASADVEVRWPDGAVETFAGVRANSFVRITQGQGLAVLRELPLVALLGPGDARYGEAVDFTATATAGAGAAIAGLAWDFDDGATDAGAGVSHGFRDVGDLVVRATATDTLGRAHTQARVVRVADDLQAAIVPDQEVFLPTQQAGGSVRVAFSDGAPVRGASVHVVVRYSSGNADVDALVAMLPRFVRDALGYLEHTFDGTTGSDGAMPFAVPWSIESPTPLVPFFANHPGLYLVRADGGARGSVFEPADRSYHVGIPGV